MIFGKRVGLIVVHLGSFPYYSDLVFRSIRANPHLDFLVFTDQVRRERRDGNITFKPMTKRSFEALATEKLEHKVHLSRPAKLCDFRPAFGVIFEEQLQGYDFWGHTELDLVWGDTASFLDKSHFRDFDVVSNEPLGLCGGFSYFRNKPRLNNLFRSMDNFAERATASNNLHLDEEGFTEIVRASGVKYFFHKFSRMTLAGRDDLLEFAGSKEAYKRVMASLKYFKDYGTLRVPALWRDGILRSYLPLSGHRDFVVQHRFWVHLSNVAVGARVDEEYDLMLPAPRETQVSASDWHFQGVV